MQFSTKTWSRFDIIYRNTITTHQAFSLKLATKESVEPRTAKPGSQSERRQLHFWRGLLTYCHQLGFCKCNEISFPIIVTITKYICQSSARQICLSFLCGCCV